MVSPWLVYDFIKSYSISAWYFGVFNYVKSTTFHALILDVTACEINYPYESDESKNEELVVERNESDDDWWIWLVGFTWRNGNVYCKKRRNSCQIIEAKISFIHGYLAIKWHYSWCCGELLVVIVFFSPQLNVITNINYFWHAFVFLISCIFFFILFYLSGMFQEKSLTNFWVGMSNPSKLKLIKKESELC